METSGPFVTIGIPVYNGEKFILAALESIKRQIYKNFECHIINNASIDRTGSLVKDFIKDDPRFFLHNYLDFVDIAANWNRTVNYISEKSKYFQLLAADDILFPDALETYVTLMEEHPSAGLACAYRLYGNGVKGYGLDFFNGNFYDGKEMLLKHLKNEVSITGSASQNFYRVEYLKRLSFYPKIYIPDDIHIDVRLAFEVLYISDLVFSFKVLSLTRIHKDSVTTNTTRKMDTPILGRENRMNRFREYFPELNGNYIRIRRKYAYKLFLNHLRRDKKSTEWHKKNLKRKITLSEYLQGILFENILARGLARISKRLFT